MTIKSREEIEIMRRVCKLAARTLENAGTYAKAGVTTNEIDKIAHDFAMSHGAKSAPLGYHGFPKSTCTSVNGVICHGVPDDIALKDGDIVNIDITCLKDGFHGDCSATFFVGNVSERAKDITNCAFEAMHKGIEAIAPNGTTGDIGFAVGKYVQRRGYHVVREIGGHGIGRQFHEEPFVPSFGKKGRGERLMVGGTITVEPMVNETGVEYDEVSIPNSTIKYYVTSDNTLSAQFEHTVLITDTGYEILTLV